MISIRCPVCTNQISYVRLKSGEGVCTCCGRILSPEEVKAQREAQLKPPKHQD
jgi:transcription initiation factor TFIIIB Brf1 subunit/transcription initiation factor TFIIB